MNKKLFSVLGILALLLALVPVAVSAAPDLPDYKVVDVGPELRAWGAEPERIASLPSADELAETEAAAAEASTSLAVDFFIQ